MGAALTQAQANRAVGSVIAAAAGAVYGRSGVPVVWLDFVHGWPNMTVRGLAEMAGWAVGHAPSMQRM